MRTKIVAALTAMTLAIGGVALVAPAAGADTALAISIAAVPTAQAPIANAKKAKKPIVVRAKVRKAPDRLNDRDYLHLLDGFIEVKDRDMNKAGVVGIVGIKEGAAASKPLWKAKKGQRVRIVRSKGKNLNLKVTKRLKLSKIGDDGPTEAQLKNTKAVIVLNSAKNPNNGRVIFLG
ncbi:hypothetical protein SAMN06309944_1704 [Micrococcales bacterium KH10]|nr:hypothetical protein SAMN06309944_1704 [Micrococcales bacterium KH10]